MYFKAFIATGVLLVTSAGARADSIVLDSVTGETYSYGLALNAAENVYFPSGTGITLSGLSGVTGVSLSFAASCFSTVISSSSVILTQTTNQAACSFLNPSSNPTEFTNLFSVQSVVLTPGLVSFALNGLPSASGSVEGPAAISAVPEPSSIALLSTGLLGIGAAARRRFN